MDLIVLFISLVCYFNNKKPWGVVGFLGLSTNYFMLGAKHDELFFRHDIQYSAVLFILVVFFVELIGPKKWVYATKKVQNYLKIGLFFLVFAISYDVLLRQTALLDVFTSVKTWFLLLTFFVFSSLKYEELHKILNLVCTITLIHVIIYYIQFFTGITIVNTKLLEQNYSTGNYTRMGYPPFYAYLVILLILSNVYKLKPSYRYLFLVLTIGTTFLSLSRSMTAAFLLGILIYTSFRSVNAFRYTLLGVFLVFLLPYIGTSFPIFFERFADGFTDIGDTLSNIGSAEHIGTFSYRILHLSERILYISKDFMTSLIGIGFVHEKNFTLDPFVFGIYKEEYSAIAQLDTADISWSGLFLRFGFLGTFLYVLFFVHFIKVFYRFNEYPIAKIGFTYLIISLMMLSFSSGRIAFGTFWPLVFLIYYFLQKQLL